MKIHIKRGSSKTFCGIIFTVWRKGADIYVDKAGISTKKSRCKDPLDTGTYKEADCSTCKNTFQKTAEIMDEAGTLSELVQLIMDRRIDR